MSQNYKKKTTMTAFCFMLYLHYKILMDQYTKNANLKVFGDGF